MSHFADDDTLRLIEGLNKKLTALRVECSEKLEHAYGSNAILKQQLANSNKQNVLLRDAIEEGLSTYLVPRTARIMEALTATQDLSGYIVCDAEPVGYHCQNSLTGEDFMGDADYDSAESGWTKEPVYKAKED
jgi:hypothetical protein